ncbi:branched-chain amino acid ABC transporter permease [Kitasatospora sp. NPDC048540]|uniref:branched-chain amino acid ABC transporter permease n=1 Tax=unclassified Kitasatospora TaxID=2633591 RepID=UPI00053A866A|nr:branched-chain amino acid ABC transporter permease [Kitasatospora sp. MBT63]
MVRFLNLTLAGITDGMIFATIALALVMIFRATRVINFAQGAMMMLTTFVGWTVQDRTGSYWLALGCALAAGLVLGTLVERVFIRPVENGPELNAAVVALGLIVLINALASMIWGSTPRAYPVPFSLRGYSVGGVRLLLSPNDLFTIGMVAFTMTALVLLFRRTALGLRMRAGAYSPELARLLGVRVGATLTIGWALAGLIGALAGVLIAPVVFLGPDQFDTVLVYGFTAAIIGGLESPVGSVVGGLLLGCTLSYVSGYAGSEVTSLGACAVLLVALMARPSGLFGPATGRRV